MPLRRFLNSAQMHQFRIATIAEAARENVDLIYTFCYAKDSDDAHVAEVLETVESNGGEVCFVPLTAEKEEIEKRILSDSRLKYCKLKDVEILRRIWRENELFRSRSVRHELGH